MVTVERRQVMRTAAAGMAGLAGGQVFTMAAAGAGASGSGATAAAAWASTWCTSPT